jgi:hypothetical protein
MNDSNRKKILAFLALPATAMPSAIPLSVDSSIEGTVWDVLRASLEDGICYDEKVELSWYPTGDRSDDRSRVVVTV